jgi:hypothetical protein
MAYSYDAFISYRRGDASMLARWIRNRLQRYRLPPELLDALPPEKRTLHERRPRIYLDTAYEKSSPDFLENKILPALASSERLIVISTPSSFLPIRDKDGAEQPNWMVREVDSYLGAATADQALRPIDVVLGPQGPDDRFPGRLEERQRWDWIDLRAFTWWRAFGFSEALDAGFTKLVAGLYEVPETFLPVLRREERRRRRRWIVAGSTVGSVILLIIGILAIGWWSETRSRQAVDHERRMTIARRLIDIGAIPNALDTLARLVDETGSTADPEAVRLLSSWSARLMTANEQFALIPNNTVFRWRGRNYLKSDGRLRLSYEGPPVLQSAIASSGEWLVTFDADRVLRVRAVDAPAPPLMETGRLNVAPGIISEALSGRLILFQSENLGLHSDEDKADAQLALGRFTAIIDPRSRTWATAIDSQADRDEFGCERLRLVANEIQLTKGGNPGEGAGTVAGELVVAAGDPPVWTVNEMDVFAAPGAAAVSPRRPVCPPKVLTPGPVGTGPTVPVALSFPSLRREEAGWSSVTIPAEETAEIQLCSDEIEPAPSTPPDCYRAQTATSVSQDGASTLGTILRSPEQIERFQVGTDARVAVLSVLGNQSSGTAYCALSGPRALDRCLVVVSTARGRSEYLLGKRFLVVNSLEIHADTFQLADLGALRFIRFDVPPAEQLAATAMSSDASRLAAVTSTGEVWLYAIDAGKGEATIVNRYDFGAIESTQKGQQPDAGEKASGSARQDVDVFTAATFLDNDRLALAGAKAGVLLADITSGSVVWSRSPIPVPGSRQRLAFDDRQGLLAVYGDSSAQLLSPSSGALLSGIVDFDQLARSSPASRDNSSGLTAAIGPRGTLGFEFKGMRYEPTEGSSRSTPGWSEVEKRTAIGRNGQPVTLPDLLDTSR